MRGSYVITKEQLRIDNLDDYAELYLTFCSTMMESVIQTVDGRTIPEALYDEILIL